jgi:hypothetical protein
MNDTKSLTKQQRENIRNTGKTKIGRNETCPCGSGKKFKRCCFIEYNLPDTVRLKVQIIEEK